MSVEEQRPTDPITALDAARIAIMFSDLQKAVESSQKALHDEIQKTRRTFREELQQVTARMATISRDEVEIKAVLEQFSSELAQTRVNRLQQEILEAELEKRLLQERINIQDEKLKMKVSDTAGAMDTNDRMKKAAELTFAEREKLRREKNQEWWNETFRKAGQTIIITLSVSGVLGVLAFLWWLVQLYLNR